MDWKLPSVESPPKPDRDHPFLARHDGGYWGLIFWSDQWQQYAAYWDGDPVPDKHPITHWMPLPEPPK